jgi:uncharacterized membrane protein YhhN
MHRIIITIYWLLALSYIINSLGTPYSWGFLLKASPIFLLAAVIIKCLSLPAKWLLVGAILCSACGDILLALSIEHSFILGLSAFAFAHIFYAWFLYPWQDLSRLTPLTFGLISVYVVCMLLLLVPAVGALLAPVLLYFVVISLMFLSAFLANTQTYALRIGAILFILSDSLLAINAFITSLPLQSVLVMSSYYAAQYFIATGCMALAKERHEI